METIRKNLTWRNKPSVAKGNLAEAIVKEFLQNKGFIVYEPVTDGAHGFDMLAVKDKKQFIIAECKAKAKRTKYDDTGFNIRHYFEYKFVQEKHGIPVFVFFIDEHLMEIYGNFLAKLEKETLHEGEQYPKWHNGIVYFPMCNMLRDIARLTEKDSDALKSYSRRNYEYLEK